METLLLKLSDYGFERTDFVYEPGQFAIRGGILDIYSYGNDKPYRIELFGKDPSLILCHTNNGNTVLHAWLRVKREDDESAFKLLHMFLDRLRESNRIPSNLDELANRIINNIEQSCERSVLLWTLNSLYGFSTFKSNDHVLDNISIIVEYCSQGNASNKTKKKLLEHLLMPILYFYRPKVLENQSIEDIYYNASLFQRVSLSEALLDQIEQAL